MSWSKRWTPLLRRRAGRAEVAAPMSRRAFLGGSAATITLPFLPSLERVAYAGGEPPVRLIFYQVPNGMRMEHWTPATTGPLGTLPPILEPLTPHRDQTMVITGLANRMAMHDSPGDHVRGSAATLTCRSISRDRVRVGESVDQVAARQLGAATPFDSLQFSAFYPDFAACDSGYPCVYTHNISWVDETTPRVSMATPAQIFDRLFQGFDTSLTAEERLVRRARRQSILDHVTDDADRLALKLSMADRAKLDQYLTGVRELEVLLDTPIDTEACDPGVRPPTVLTWEQQVHQVNRLMALALECDLTRIATFHLWVGGTSREYDFLGLSGSHHTWSHHQSDPNNLDRLTTVGRWHVSLMADTMERLRQIPEGNGTMLDHSIVYLTSEIEDGDAHRHTNKPVVVGGGGGGRLATGQHLDVGDQPMADLFMALLSAAGAPVASFGEDGSQPLSGVLVS